MIYVYVCQCVYLNITRMISLKPNVNDNYSIVTINSMGLCWKFRKFMEKTASLLCLIARCGTWSDVLVLQLEVKSQMVYYALSNIDWQMWTIHTNDQTFSRGLRSESLEHEWHTKARGTLVDKSILFWKKLSAPIYHIRWLVHSLSKELQSQHKFHFQSSVSPDWYIFLWLRERQLKAHWRCLEIECVT